MIELDGGGAGRDRLCTGALLNHRREIEDFEYAFEGDERSHDADLDVGESDEGRVETSEVGSKRYDCAYVEDVVDSEDASPTICKRGCNDGHRGEGGEEEAAVN